MTVSVPRELRIVLTALLLIVTAGASPKAASADEGCPHGDLDDRYCDRDGDLVADPPERAVELLDPGTLVFAYTPVEDPSVYRKAWKGFLDHLGRMTGKRVVFFPVQSNAAQIEAMRAGRLHVAGFNTGSVPFAVNAAGFVPFAMMAAKDGSFGYEMEIVVRAEGPIREVADLAGRKLAFTSPTSNSGYKAPTALLRSEFSLEAGRDFESAFSGKHDNSVLGVLHGDYDAAAVADVVLDRMAERGVIDPAALRTIYRSRTFPTTAYGTVYNLEPELARKVREAFFSFPWEGSDLQREFRDGEGERFVPITYREHWKVIRDIDRANGVEYVPGRSR